MKTFRNILYLCLVTLFITSCEPTVKKVYNIDMQKVNGEWINETHVLPENITLFIYTYSSTYSLAYKGKEHELDFGGGPHMIRHAIIDFKVKKISDE